MSFFPVGAPARFGFVRFVSFGQGIRGHGILRKLVRLSVGGEKGPLRQVDGLKSMDSSRRCRTAVNDFRAFPFVRLAERTGCA